MELEREPRRKPTPPKSTPARGPTPVSPTTVTRTYTAPTEELAMPNERTYAREVCVIQGILFLTIGLIGFVVTDLFSAHLSASHNAIHLASGALALWFGFDSERSARIYSFAFGAVYGTLALLGFALGKTAMATVGHVAEDRFLWKLIPGVLEFGTADHIIHILIASAFILGAALKIKRVKRMKV
ncbi:hypothetical protein AZI87_02335 [Bdellovibrio bacteriovorus]|uniref:DUF4383 domain-containing protein n=1 Tax=Bdellovibrio bacteriovorus TaxID=959 RepID=A0A162GGW0_BDEBC|nr:DUF4383 domain-containing protein [Bdellovibrio bacteriovorus]KYG68119.1 hypothetical protein AZI87_02335 [Bdellovibrio bacteriovorus]